MLTCCLFRGLTVSVIWTDSAQDASSHVPAVTEPVLNEFDVLHVIFDDADQMT